MKYTAAVLTVSDKGSKGEREDTSGKALMEVLNEKGYEVMAYDIVPDEREEIKAKLIEYSDRGINLILTTGGTGFSKRDITPEATLDVIERRADGIAYGMIAKSLEITPKAILSRAAAGLRGNSLIINLPGSRKAALENLEAVIDPIHHGIEILLGTARECGSPNPSHKKI